MSISIAHLISTGGEVRVERGKDGWKVVLHHDKRKEVVASGLSYLAARRKAAARSCPVYNQNSH